ncbi:MAG: DUF2723 domain-containing protein [bacterium]
MNKWLSLFIFFFTFGVYLRTLTPGVGLDDSGELVTCAYLLSIAHAPGYPLYLLIGKVFTFLPFGEIAFRLNLMSALFSALSCSLIFLIIFFITRSRFSGLMSSFCFGFSYTCWTLSIKAEVYTLNIFLLSLLIVIFLIWRQGKKTLLLYLFFFIYGLSPGNHLTIILFLPIFFYFIIKERVRQLGKFILPFFLGLSIYLYIPIRSFDDIIVVNWSKVTTFNDFFNYISGSHFKKLLFCSPVFEVTKNLWHYFLLLITQFPAFAFSFGIIGFLKSFNKNFTLLISLMWLFLVIFCINYDIGDIWSLYLPTYLFFSLFIGMGIWFLIKRTSPHKQLWTQAIIIISLFFSFQLPYWLGGYKIDRSKYFSPYDFCSQALRWLPHNSLVISNWGYATCFWYCQNVSFLRKDIKVVTCKKEKGNLEIMLKKYPSYSSIYLIYPRYEYFSSPRNAIFKICKREIKKLR